MVKTEPRLPASSGRLYGRGWYGPCARPLLARIRLDRRRVSLHRSRSGCRCTIEGAQAPRARSACGLEPDTGEGRGLRPTVFKSRYPGVEYVDVQVTSPGVRGYRDPSGVTQRRRAVTSSGTGHLVRVTFSETTACFAHPWLKCLFFIEVGA